MSSAGYSRLSILLLLLCAVALLGAGALIFKGMNKDVAAAPKTTEQFVEFASSDLATVAGAELRSSNDLSLIDELEAVLQSKKHKGADLTLKNHIQQALK